MPAISRLIAVAPDGDLAESLRFAFERDGTEISLHSGADGLASVSQLLAKHNGDETVRGHDAIIALGESSAGAEDLLVRLRALVKQSPLRMPIVYLGNELSEKAGLAAGANAVLEHPLFLRDVVVATGLIARRRRADLTRGDLRDFDGLFYIIRALTQFRRSAVLTLVRGLRRGEIRIFEGHVTSAQVGTLHGLSALHHLTLWRVGTFELRFENVVQRKQIPMGAEELMNDLQRFLAEVRESAGTLAFVGSYEAEDDLVAQAEIPHEINEVLDLMDGSRTLPDAIEDSPFRVFDTLRIVHRLLEHELIRHVTEISSDFGFKIRRRVEDLVLSENSAVPMSLTGQPTGQTTVRLTRPPDDRAVESEKKIFDWSDVMPSSPSREDKLAQVVPAAVAAGEITVSGAQRAQALPPPKRASGNHVDPTPRSENALRPEQLETFTNSEQRDSMFALGVTPATERTRGRSQQSAKAERPQDAMDAMDADDNFTDDEEAFFQAGQDIGQTPTPPVDNFEDLDDGYQPVSFWQRLFGRGQRPDRERPPLRRADSKAKTAPEPLKAKTAPEPLKAKTAPEPLKAKTAPEPLKAKTAPEPAKAKIDPDETEPNLVEQTDHSQTATANSAGEPTPASLDKASTKRARAQTKSDGKKRKRRKKRKKR